MPHPVLNRSHRRTVRKSVPDGTMSRVAIAAAFSLLLNVYAADQWPQFRGPRAGTVADDRSLPESWSDRSRRLEDGYTRARVGLGWSSPVVWDDHVFLTTPISTGLEAAPIKGLFDPSEGHGTLRSP